MIRQVNVKEFELKLCDGFNMVSGNYNHLGMFLSGFGGIKKSEYFTISSHVDNEKDHSGIPTLVWSRPEKWADPSDMAGLARQIKEYGDRGSQVILCSNSFLLFSWVALVSEYSHTPLPFRFFNFYEEKHWLCMEESESHYDIRKHQEEAAYGRMIDIKLEMALEKERKK